MKRILSLLLTLVLLAAPCALADAPKSLADVPAALEAAVTNDEALTVLCDAAARFSTELETGGWNVKLNAPLPEPLPDGLVPESWDGAVEADSFPDKLRGLKYLVLLDDDGELRLLGDYAARLTGETRAQSVAEAEAVLLVRRWYQRRGDYIGEAYNTYDAAYAWRVGGDTVYRLFAACAQPPYSGMGALYGAGVSREALFQTVRPDGALTELATEGGTLWFQRMPEGCALVRAEGSGVSLTVPETVGDLPVRAIRNCALGDSWPALETVTLPDSVTEIGNSAFSGCEKLVQINLPPKLETIGNSAFSGCKSLTELTMPDSLRTIGSNVFFNCSCLTALNLNEGLESVGRSITANCYALTRINIPSTLSILPDGFLHGGCAIPCITVPEGVKEIEMQALDCSELLCAFLPASVETFGTYNAVDENTIIFAPEDSAAMRWAQASGREAVACERAEDMPRPVLGVEGDFAYATLNGEATMRGYSGESAEVTVPGTLGGFPVTRMGHLCFFPSAEDFVTSITLPASVNRFAARTISYFDNPCTLTIPAMTVTFGDRAIDNATAITIVSPEGSSAQAYALERGCPWRALEQTP